MCICMCEGLLDRFHILCGVCHAAIKNKQSNLYITLNPYTFTSLPIEKQSKVYILRLYVKVRRRRIRAHKVDIYH